MSLKISSRFFLLNMVLLVLFVFPLTACSSTGSQSPDSVETPKYIPVDLPAELTFAGEKVPLEYYDVRENLDREMLSTAYFHSQTIRYLMNAPRFFPVIEPILKSYGIPDDFKYLCVAESGLDVRAVSPANAVGLWQILEATAKENGLEINDEVDERYHVVKSTEAACRILKSAYTKFGSWSLVAASYNGGRTFVVRQINNQKVDSYYDLLFGDETSRYIFRILSFKLVMESPEKYGFRIKKERLYPVVETKTIEISGPVKDWADFAIEKGINYKILKMFNPWLRETYLKNPNNKTYTLRIPVEGFRTKTN
ncbi:MAG TPA: lytic transglycosylase domain-containing protein [Prolixibacteraceae bacterium]|nr:lytic transglycosylase domain-containing protein [Prolixibacteraceae bacterium]